MRREAQSENSCRYPRGERTSGVVGADFLAGQDMALEAPGVLLAAMGPQCRRRMRSPRWGHGAGGRPFEPAGDVIKR